MSTTTVSPDIAWLAERQLVVGARVGSCVVARQAGTVIAVTGLDDLTVRWDDGQTESVRWTAVSPFGYVVEVAPEAAPTPSQWASAAMHLGRRDDWRTIRLDGQRYVVIASGRSGKVYWLPVTATGCSCPWFANRGRQCSHMLAVELAAMGDELAAEQVASAFPPCRVCGSLTDGPRRLCDGCAAEQARRLETTQKRTAVAA